MRPAPAIADADDARRLFAPLAAAARELVAVAYLDPEWRILGIRHTSGTRDHVRPTIRAIIRDALSLEARAIVLAHNHPSGDPAPSAADLAFTRRCAGTLAAIDVRLVDHLILARGGWTSFRARGLL